MSEISADAVRRAVKEVEHPEISRTLEELGMIRDVAVEGHQVRITVAIPFPTIPILDLLVQLVRDAALRADSNVEVGVEVVEMNPEEKERFLQMARQGWKLG